MVGGVGVGGNAAGADADADTFAFAFATDAGTTDPATWVSDTLAGSGPTRGALTQALNRVSELSRTGAKKGRHVMA